MLSPELSYNAAFVSQESILNSAEMQKYLDYLDGRSSGNELAAIAKLEESGVNIPRLLMKRYKISRRWADRASCVNHCMKYAKTDENAYQLGIIALHDKSKMVRRKACILLSAAQRREAIEHLNDLLSNESSSEDAAAAINALASFDHRQALN